MSFPRYPAYRGSGVTWLGDIPTSWGLSRLCHVSWVRARLGWKGLKADEYVDDGLAFLSTPNIKQTAIDFENVSFITRERYNESPEIKLRVGDVLLAKDGSTLGTVNVVRSLPRETTVNSSIAVISPGKALSGVYLAYVFQSAYMQNTIESVKDGMGVPHLFQSDINKFYLPMPSLDEQCAIAAFLDRETAKIDALVAEQRHLMELLQEKRQALISHAVTKGLDPDAPMEDSGAEWLGEVPAHWAVVPLRRCVSEHRQGYYTEEGYLDEGGVKLVRITDLRKGGFVDFSECPLVRDCSELRPFLLRNSDFLFARTGGAGSFGLVADLEEPAAYASYLIRFRFSEPAEVSFLRWFFLSRSFRDAVGASIHGGVNKNIHAENIKDQLIALPPPSEQRVIADWLVNEVARVEALIEVADHATQILSERRAALITAAVTGQIDVRGEAAAEAA